MDYDINKNYYQILHVSRTASIEEIKKAYRMLSKKYHPDSNPGRKDAQEQFQKIAEAYAILQDSKKRMDYDKELEKQEEVIFSKKEKRTGSSVKRESGIKFREMEQFEKFFGYQKKEAENKRKNPLDMTELFEHYMGIKKER